MAPSTKRLDDPRTMRAIAHPLRLRLLGLLRIDGPATATALAGATGDSVPLVSYHLNQLSKHGFIEEAPELARDNRERWWKASHEFTSWSSADFLDTPERIDAAAAFNREVVRVYTESLEHFVAEQQAWGREWIEGSELSDYALDLTPDEAGALIAELREVLGRWNERSSQRADSEHVRTIFAVFPFKSRPGP
ncbi:MAG: helix-turn-helix domain-containing protein [Actinomycetota bacterium]